MSSFVFFQHPFKFPVFLRVLPLSLSLLLPAHYYILSSLIFRLFSSRYVMLSTSFFGNNLLSRLSHGHHHHKWYVRHIITYITLHYICICICPPDHPSPPVCCSIGMLFSACEMWCSFFSSCCGSCITSYIQPKIFLEGRDGIHQDN